MKNFSSWAVPVGLSRSNGVLTGRATVVDGYPCMGIFLAVVLLTSFATMAQDPSAFPPGVEQRESELMMQMGPHTQAWIMQEARRGATQPGLSEQTMIARIRANFSGSDNLEESDIIAIAFILAVETARAVQEDLKSAVAEAHSNSDTVVRLRQRQTTVPGDVALSKPGNPSSEQSVAVRSPMPKSRAAVTTPRPAAKAQLDSHVIKPESYPESMGWTNTEITMQRIMDRESLAMAAVASLMKKYAEETQSNTIKNTK